MAFLKLIWNTFESVCFLWLWITMSYKYSAVQEYILEQHKAPIYHFFQTWPCWPICGFVLLRRAVWINEGSSNWYIPFVIVWVLARHQCYRIQWTLLIFNWNMLFLLWIVNNLKHAYCYIEICPYFIGFGKNIWLIIYNFCETIRWRKRQNIMDPEI